MGNSSGKRSTSSASRDQRPKKNVHWKSAEPPSAPGKPMLSPTYDALSEAITMKWERPNTDGGSPIIGYLVEQRRIGSPTWTKAAASLVPHPELIVHALEPGRRFQFRVFAQNVVGVSESSLFSDPIAIPVPNSIVVPQFLSELQDTVVLENDQCEFNVSVIGTPMPQINWFKDGFEIFSSRRTKIINDRGSSTLIIHQTALTDEGEIKCTATNRAGHVVTRMQLLIEAPPRIRLPRQYEDGFLVEAGEVIKLKVGVAGRPTPSIAWMHNGEIIKNDDGRHEITTNEKNSFLKIVKAVRRDRGEYNVRAVNKLGEFNTSFLVTVTAKPSPPENVRITMSLGQSVTLTWSAPHDDGGCKIGNYIVEYYRIGWNVWLKASATRQLTATLNDLIEGSEYKFRVKAESPYGMSEPSTESRILFIPDHKRGITAPSREATASPSATRKSYERESKPTPSVNQIVISEVPKNVELISQIYDNESIARELNYGTKVDIVYKKKEITSSPISSQPNRMPNHVSMVDDRKRTAPVTSHIDNGNQKRPQNNNAVSNRLTAPMNSEEMHSSNEYMLVLYDENKQSKETQNRTTNQFDLELEEAIAPPPLSLSVPDLQDYAAQQMNQPLRRSASSTELLYEKAMQRFYQAVELDEAEMERKRSMSVEPKANTSQRLVRNDNDERPKQTASINKLQSPQTSSHQTNPKLSNAWSTYNNNNDSLEIDESDTVEDGDDDEGEGDDDNTSEISEMSRDLRQEILDLQRKRNRGRNTGREPIPKELYEDDYTDSTASTASISASVSVESIEQFMNSVRSASSNANNTRSTMNDELETYHPRMDGIRALSPYRSPEPGQAAIILNKPSPLPDPDYVPKPILKRPANEMNNIGKKEKEKEKEAPVPVKESPKPIMKFATATVDKKEKTIAKPEKPISKPEKPIAKPEKSIVKPEKEKTPKMEKSQKIEKSQKPEKTVEKVEKSEKRGFLNLFDRKKASPNENVKNKKSVAEPPTPAPAPAKGTEKEKKKLMRQNSEEENKVVIDHYSDLVRELGGTRDRPRVPLYMNSEALRAAAERAEWEEQQSEAAAAAKAAEEQRQALAIAKADAEEANRVQELAIKLKQFQEPSPVAERSRSSSFQKDMVEISVEQTKSISFALREIKHDPSMSVDATIDSEVMRKSCRRPSGTHNQTMTTTQSRSTSRNNSVSIETTKRNSIDSRSNRRSHSKSPMPEHRTSLTSTVLRVKRMPIQRNLNSIDIDLSPSVSPEPRCQTPDELQAAAESNVKYSLSYTTDLAMFLFACWLYVFKDARWAIPILTLMVYRQVRSAIEKKLQKWTKRKLKSE